MSKPAFPSYPLPPTRQFTVAPGVTLAYALTPASSASTPKSAVVLVQGWTGVKEDWYGLVPFLAAIGHTVIVFDHRGFGESATTTTAAGSGSGGAQAEERYSLELLADDAAKLIRGVLPGEKVHFMGISMGGMVAQVFAARHPALLHTVILGCTLPSITDPQNPPVVHMLPLPTTPPSNAAERRAVVEQLLALNYTDEWVKQNQERYQWYVDDSMRWTRPLKTTIKQSQAIGRFNGLATIDQIQHLPILIIHGTRDGVIPVTQAHALAERLPRADLVLLQDVGHLFWNQAEKETHSALQIFLTKHEEHSKRNQPAAKL